MRVSDIIDEVAEAVGACSGDAILYKTITRAVQLLANKQLVDPLIGYYDFSTQNSYFVALPRDCKTVLKVNINQSPSITRSRLFEFALNSDGTQDGANQGVEWADRGYSPIQDERQLPGALAYKCTVSADNGKQCLVWGLDSNGREIQEALTADVTTPIAGTKQFHKILRVARDATTRECFLWCNGTNVAAQYYADETEPLYRVIKLSSNPASVRIIYRRHVYAVTTLDDFIPMTSELAVIYAAKCVRFIAKNEDQQAAAALTFAVQCLTDEQASRDEHTTLAEQTELPGATNTPINVRDGITVSDVYDTVCAIFGPLGRAQIFDRLTMAVEALSNRGQWDARLGVCDVYTPDGRDTVNYTNDTGSGLFVLPRYVETPVQVNICRKPLVPRNKWFEFHLNATGEHDIAPCRSFDDMGEVVLTRALPLDGTVGFQTRQTIPTYLVAAPDTNTDDDTPVRIFGLERLSDGRDVEVWRAGELGWSCPCVFGSFNPGDEAPQFTRVDRITKGSSQGFIKLYAAVPTTAVNYTANGDVFGVNSTIEYLTGTFTVAPAAGQTIRINGVVSTIVSASPDEHYLVVTDVANGATEGATIYLGANVTTWAAGTEYGYWYPDELEPKYRAIRLPRDKATRIRVVYRKRTSKFTSLSEPIPLRSRMAIEDMLRALKVRETDPVLAREHEANALKCLREERINLGPSETGALQVDEETLPAVWGCVM